MHCAGSGSNSAMAFRSVREIAMKNAAGTPLPETSAITKTSRPSGRSKKS